MTNRLHSLRGLVAALVLGMSMTAAAWANGVLTGMVLDGRTGQPVRGAVLSIEGQDMAFEADLNGIFQLQVDPGSWTVVVTRDGYEKQRVVDVVVGNGEVANLSVVLNPAAETVEATRVEEEITVTAEAIAATEQAMLTERRAASQILDNIGSEEISKNSGSEAAGVLKRVTGISIQDDKYVFVRGLGERYSNTTLNGSRIPSTEFERKVVPLDLFSADLLEKITVRKSYTVDQPGDFVAGVVELVTKNFPVKQHLSVGVSGGFNSVTTGESYLRYGSGLSFSGGGGQALPASVPSEPLVLFNSFTKTGFTAAELEAFGESLIGDWQGMPARAPLDRGYQLSYGNSFGRFGMVLSAGQESDREVRDEVQNYYTASASRGLEKLNTFDLTYGEEKVRNSLMGNFAYRLGDSTQVQVRALDTRLATAEGREQFGFFSDEQRDIRDYRVQYKEQEVQSFQFSGDHFLSGVGSGGSVLEWRASTSTAVTAENLREVIYAERNGSYEYTNLGQSGFFFFNDLEDDLDDARADWSTFRSGERSFGSFRLGVATTNSKRDFAGRRLRYLPRSTRNLDLALAPNELYSVANIRPDGFQLQEVTNPTDSYQGSLDIIAGYAQADWTFGNWRLIGGVRLEDSNQQVDIVQRDLTAESTVLDYQRWLPSLSLVYSVADRQQIRASLSKTVNRPEYRELAPFNFKQVVGGYLAVGNPELQPAEITSADVRWEWFPVAADVLALSVFFKDFSQPIEAVVIGSNDPTQTFLNAAGAKNFGFEAEARRNLGAIHKGLSAWTGVFNYTFVDSEISIDPNETVLTNAKRPLTGQPQNTLNAVLEWAPERSNSTFRLLYNFTDDKIFLGGANGLPDILEDARGTLDLVFQQGFARGLLLKASFTNLLESDRIWLQGSEVWRGYQPGRGFGLSLGFSL